MKTKFTIFALILGLHLNAFEAPEDPIPRAAHFDEADVSWEPLKSLLQPNPHESGDTRGKGHQYTLAIATIFKNEAPYLREWIEYHLMMGVDHFYLYNNMSEDDYLAVLEPYIESDIVTLVDWPNQDEENWGEKRYAWVHSTQQSSMLDAIEISKHTAKWLAVIDTDEFMVPVIDDTLVAFIRRYDRYPGIRLRWQTYGTSGVSDIPPGHLMIELLTHKAPADAHMNSFVKEIVRPKHVKGFKWVPHMFNYSSRLLPYKPSIMEARINHYTNRTIGYFHSTKVKNKESMDNRKMSEEEINTAINSYNEIEDRIMDRFIPMLKQRMGY